jgi:hypothetical protein
MSKVIVTFMIESLMEKHLPTCGSTVAIEDKHYYIQEFNQTYVDDDGYYRMCNFTLEPLPGDSFSANYTAEDFHAIAVGEATFI